MSELKVDKVSPRTGNYVALNTVGSKNIIINGDMSIAQRGTSETGLTNGFSGYYTVDRWRFDETGAPTAVFTMSQDTDVPTGQGFAKSMKWDCTTAQGSLASGDSLKFEQRFEGQMLQYLKKGTSNAESLTCSFWVKSNKTGTYIVELDDVDNSRNINKSYTIDSANTWEKKTITFAGDTTGTLDNDNAVSFRIFWWLAAGTDFTSGTLATSWESTTDANRAVGQVNLADNTANEWFITGVQLEAGTTASDFEFLPYDVNLQRCYRYCYRINGNAVDETNIGGFAFKSGTSRINLIVEFNPPLRAVPTISSSSDLKDAVESVTGLSFFATINNDQVGICNTIQIAIDDAGAFTSGSAGVIEVNNSTSSFVEYDAEL